MLYTLIRAWEVPDRLPERRVDAVVGMSIAHMDDGTVGSALRSVIIGCLQLMSSLSASNLIISNRFLRNGVVLSELMRSELVWLGVSGQKIVTPSAERNSGVHNTYTEVEYAIEQCKKFGYKSVVVIANHIHMRRTLAAFLVAMKRQSYKVQIYNLSVGRDSYGKQASCQPSFLRPEFFLLHEMVPAFVLSVLRGWWQPWLNLK